MYRVIKNNNKMIVKTKQNLEIEQFYKLSKKPSLSKYCKNPKVLDAQMLLQSP